MTQVEVDTTVYDIAPAMITVDRGPHQKNYLRKTLLNLFRDTYNFSTPNLEVFDSKPGGFAEGVVSSLNGVRDYVFVKTPAEPLCANLNVAAALRSAAFRSDWVLFLEDDIDVCCNFIDSVCLWLSDFVDERYRVYSFGSTAVRPNQPSGIQPYPHRTFYGTQAFAIRSVDAISLAAYLETHAFSREADPPHQFTTDSSKSNGTCWDLIMVDWSREAYPDQETFAASIPSFVQHIGRESVVRPRPQTHSFKSFDQEFSYS